MAKLLLRNLDVLDPWAGMLIAGRDGLIAAVDRGLDAAGAEVVDLGGRALMSGFTAVRDAGVKMAFGTDLLGELQVHQPGEFAIRAAVLTPLEIIRSATLVGAGVLGMEGRLGVVEPGAFADLLAVDGNPLEDLAPLQDDGAHLALIVKDGAVVKNGLRP